MCDDFLWHSNSSFSNKTSSTSAPNRSVNWKNVAIIAGVAIVATLQLL